MRKAQIVSAIALVLIVSAATRAESPQADPFLAVYYDNNESMLCRDYLTADGARFATYQWWLLGFVSGANYVSSTMKRPIVGIEMARVLGSAEDHCRAKPTDTLATAAVAVLQQLMSPRNGQ